MAPRKPARRQRTPIKAPVGDDLGVLVGTLIGRLNEHIDTVADDRQRLDDDRDAAAQYRKEMRADMESLKEGVAKIEPLTKRVKLAEDGVKDWLSIRERITGARLAIAGAVTAVGFFFGGDIKSAALHFLKG